MYKNIIEGALSEYKNTHNQWFSFSDIENMSFSTLIINDNSTLTEIEFNKIIADYTYKITVPQSITALQGLLAIDVAGLSVAYEVWANDVARTFAEKAFINRAQIWKRDDTTLLSAATIFGLTDLQLDELFILGATL